MNAIMESVFTMEGHFDQDALNLEKEVKPSKSPVVSLSAKRVPRWYRQTVSDLYAILALDSNWDSYGAKRINPNTARAVDELLLDIMHPQSPAPQVVPAANGNIQLEWHLGGIDLEIEVESLSTAFVYFNDRRDEIPEWDGEIKYDLSTLVQYINLLTARVQPNNQ